MLESGMLGKGWFFEAAGEGVMDDS